MKKVLNRIILIIESVKNRLLFFAHKTIAGLRREQIGKKLETWKEKEREAFRRKWKRSFWKIILLGFRDATLIVLSAIFLAVGYVYFFATDGADNLDKGKISETSVIYDRTGQHILYEIHGEENRKVVAHDEIPDAMRIATIAAEDTNFYLHHGVDIKGILRAIKVNLERVDMQQGGSTITQQLARNVFLTREKTLERKLLEFILAFKIEQKYSKDEILDFYLNTIPYGSNAYGIRAAAETFFGKEPHDLTLDEAALIASLPKATTYYSPYGNNKEGLVWRQKMILGRIRDLGLEKQEKVEWALTQNTLAKIIPLKQEIEAPHFVFYVKEQLEEIYGSGFVENGGLKIYTTLDYEAQKRAEEVVKKGVEKNLAQDASNAALVAINPKNGDVLAMVGSRDYFDKNIDGEVNVVTRLRQPGSVFKPIVYAKAFEKGFQPETYLFDVRTNFGPDGSGNDYVPNNYNGNFYGLVSMRQALAMSLNIPAVKTLYLAGIDETIDLAKRLGISSLNNRDRYGLSLVLGGGEISLLDGTSAFSVFANDGVRNSARAIIRIEDKYGHTYDVPQIKNERVLDAQVARKINSVLSDNVARSPIFGGQNYLHISGKSVAAKTGTTQEFRDAWTIGFTPDLAVGVWVGNNDNHSMRLGADGSVVAAPIWREFIASRLQNFSDKPFIAYDKVISDKKMITGNIDAEIKYYKKKSGKKISESDAQKRDPDEVKTKIKVAKHDILFYVNKNNPLGDEPPDFGDEMARRWDMALDVDFENELMSPKK